MFACVHFLYDDDDDDDVEMEMEAYKYTATMSDKCARVGEHSECLN